MMSDSNEKLASVVLGLFIALLALMFTSKAQADPFYQDACFPNETDAQYAESL